jgi:divalent metal cation (Fe/Co/Zn/Cd) transporter
MKKVSELFLVAASAFFAASLQAHEGHASVGSMAHELEHAGWIAGALMLASVLMLIVFSVSVRFADKHLSDKKRRD